jgi:hypothetical protein
MTNDLPEIPDVDPTDANLDAIRQEHEPFLTKLEALAVEAIAKGFWDDVYDFINFHAPSMEDS